MIMTDLLWHLDYMTLISPALLCIFLISLILLYSCHLILTLFTLSRDLDIHYFHYMTLISVTPFSYHIHWVTHYFALALINEINHAGVTGGDCSRRNPRGVLGRATLCGFGCHTWSCYLCVLLLLHVTWCMSTVNCFSVL